MSQRVKSRDGSLSSLTSQIESGGWGAVARRLQMNDAQLSQFTLRLRHLQQSVPQYENGGTSVKTS